MRPCSHCRRHVRASESCCPFCGARLVEGTAPAAIGLAIGLAMFGAACGPGKPQDSASEGTSEGGSSGSAGTTTGASTTGEGSSGATTLLPTSTSGDGSSGCAMGCDASSEQGGFIYGSPDAGSNIDCDQFVQDCPSGQKCAPASLDGDPFLESLICVPVEPNPGQTGEPCTAEGVSGVDSCDVGNICFDIDPATMQGICVAQCSGSADQPMCAEGFSCAIAGDGVLTPCLEDCDPLAQDCSQPNQMCIDGSGVNGAFVCALDGSGAEGQAFDPCDSAIGCDPGHVCLFDTGLAEECDKMAPGCCLPFCDLSKPPTCTGAGAECLPWFEDGQAPQGLENVGLCAVSP